jgi:small subunit ribosomal protein S15
MKKEKKKIADSSKTNLKDVGSSEAQIGFLSKKIENLTDHFKKNKNDKHSTRGLLFAVNQRKRLLEYLKRNNSESYKNILTRLNLRK